MNFCRFLIATSTLFACTHSVYAGQALNAHVQYVGSYGDGHIFVALDKTIDDSTCPQPRFDVAATNPMNKQWLAIALAAQASGKAVSVQTSTCISGGNVLFPTLTQDGNSFFYISN